MLSSKNVKHHAVCVNRATRYTIILMKSFHYEEIVRKNVYRILNDKRDEGITQAGIAEKLGIQAQQLNACLKGKRPVKNIIMDLADALDVDVTDLLTDKYDPLRTEWNNLLLEMTALGLYHTIEDQIKMLKLLIKDKKDEVAKAPNVPRSSAV